MDVQRVHYTMPPESEITAKVEINHQTIEVKIMGEIHFHLEIHLVVCGGIGRRVWRRV